VVMTEEEAKKDLGIFLEEAFPNVLKEKIGKGNKATLQQLADYYNTFYDLLKEQKFLKIDGIDFDEKFYEAIKNYLPEDLDEGKEELKEETKKIIKKIENLREKEYQKEYQKLLFTPKELSEFRQKQEQQKLETLEKLSGIEAKFEESRKEIRILNLQTLEEVTQYYNEQLGKFKDFFEFFTKIKDSQFIKTAERNLEEIKKDTDDIKIKNISLEENIEASILLERLKTIEIKEAEKGVVTRLSNAEKLESLKPEKFRELFEKGTSISVIDSIFELKKKLEKEIDKWLREDEIFLYIKLLINSKEKFEILSPISKISRPDLFSSEKTDFLKKLEKIQSETFNFKPNKTYVLPYNSLSVASKAKFREKAEGSHWSFYFIETDEHANAKQISCFAPLGEESNYSDDEKELLEKLKNAFSHKDAEGNKKEPKTILSKENVQGANVWKCGYLGLEFIKNVVINKKSPFDLIKEKNEKYSKSISLDETTSGEKADKLTPKKETGAGVETTDPAGNKIFIPANKFFSLDDLNTEVSIYFLSPDNEEIYRGHNLLMQDFINRVGSKKAKKIFEELAKLDTEKQRKDYFKKNEKLFGRTEELKKIFSTKEAYFSKLVESAEFLKGYDILYKHDYLKSTDISEADRNRILGEVPAYFSVKKSKDKSKQDKIDIVFDKNVTVYEKGVIYIAVPDFEDKKRGYMHIGLSIDREGKIDIGKTELYWCKGEGFDRDLCKIKDIPKQVRKYLENVEIFRNEKLLVGKGTSLLQKINAYEKITKPLKAKTGEKAPKSPTDIPPSSTKKKNKEKSTTYTGYI